MWRNSFVFKYIRISVDVASMLSMLTQLLEQISPGVEDPSYARERQNPRFRPLLLRRVT